MYLVLSLYAYNLARLLILLGNESLQLYLSIFKSHISFNKCTIFNNAFHKVFTFFTSVCLVPFGLNHLQVKLRMLTPVTESVFHKTKSSFLVSHTNHDGRSNMYFFHNSLMLLLLAIIDISMHMVRSPLCVQQVIHNNCFFRNSHLNFVLLTDPPFSVLQCQTEKEREGEFLYTCRILLNQIGNFTGLKKIVRVVLDECCCKAVK